MGWTLGLEGVLWSAKTRTLSKSFDFFEVLSKSMARRSEVPDLVKRTRWGSERRDALGPRAHAV